MPSVPTYTTCLTLSCKQPRIKGSGYCEQHSKQVETSDTRKESNAAYQNAAWRRVRQVQLSTDPLCQACRHRGKITAAEHVDHVFPWRIVGHDSFTRNILQSLCESCHSLKTSLERRGVFRHYREGKPVDYRATDWPEAVGG